MREFLRATRPQWNPPPHYSVSQWSERFRYLSREYSALPGRYSLTQVPYAREPLDAACDPTVREVVLMWASQTTKTTVLENICGYFVHADPSPILMVQPTVEMAQAWSKERLASTIRDTPVLRDLIADAKSRQSGNTIQVKNFPGGSLAIIGANAPAGLAGRARRVVLLDEVDRYPWSAGSEGDPVSLAVRRTESFHNSVIYLTSTPTVKGMSRIEAEYEQTDRRLWHVPCHACGHMQPLKWSGVRWQSGREAQAWYECERCGEHWTDADRVAAIRAGEWRATAPFTGKRGYWLSGIYSPFRAKRGYASRLHQMVIEFLEAKSNTETHKTWVNTFLAETWEEQAERIESTELTRRLESYTPDRLPDNILLVIGGADVQRDRVEIEWIGVGRDEETWGIEALVVTGDTELPSTWQRVSQACERVYRRTDGVELRPVALAIDIHFRSRATKQWIASHGTRLRVYGVFGIGSFQPTLTRLRPNGCWSIATDQAKEIIYSRLRIAEQGPRYMHFPRSYTDDWFRQLTCERVITKYTHGFARRVFVKAAGVRNEALDVRVYSLACLDILRPNMEEIARSLAAPAAQRQGVVRRGGGPIRGPSIGGGAWMSGIR